MPTLPWFQSPAHPDAWHGVTAPGGYEWWYFDAEDAATDTRIVAILFEGFVFHPGYLRAYARYRRRPTVFAPPVARDYPCAYFVVYRGGRVWAQFMTQYAPANFAASSDAADVTVGPNRLTTRAGGLDLRLTGTPWQLIGRGPRLLTGTALAGEFTFRPVLAHPPAERPFFSRRLTGADHHWVLAHPLCEVEGTIDFGGERISFQGRGYHDHNYGTAPIGPGLKRWTWGRILFPDKAVVFHHAEPAGPGRSAESHLLDVSPDGISESPRELKLWHTRRSSWGLPYPTQITAGSGLKLTAPRVVDSSPFYLRVTYLAAYEGSNGRPATAFCEIAYPHRLRWPVLGRMIELSIDRQDRAAKPPGA